MTAMTSFLNPAAGFFGLALLLPILPRTLIRVLLPLPALWAVCTVFRIGPADFGVHGVFTYLGQELSLGRVDQLSVLFASVFAVQALLGLIYSLHVTEKIHHAAALSYVGGAFGCIFAADYLTLFVFWEIMALASTLLIWLRRTNRSTGAGFRYFLFHVLGGLFLLAGLLVRYRYLGTLEFGPVDPAAATWYDYLILLGFAVNAAVVPLHAWLPDAYPEATVPGAVFLSAFTTKTAVYVLARSFAGFEVLAVAGVIMCLWGVAYASIENNARRILAYHIVSQVGYMVAGIGIGTAMTVNGACGHAYAHILYKGLLFMAAGGLLHATGTAKLDELGGLAARLPWLFVLYMVAAVSISGMPFFNGFVTKTMTIAGAADAHRTWLALGMEIAAVGTFLSVGLKLPYFAFYAKPTNTRRALVPIPWNMYLAMGLAAGLCLFTGLYPDAIYRLLPFGPSNVPYTPFVSGPTEYHPYTVWHVLQASLLLGFCGLGFMLMRKVLTPHECRNLDFEALYLLCGRFFVSLVSRPLTWLDTLWGEVYSLIGLNSLRGIGKATSVFDRGSIDGVLDNGAYSVAGLGRGLARLQTGRLQTYAAAAVIVGLGAFILIWQVF